MENNIEKNFIRKRINDNEKIFNVDEKIFIEKNISTFIKVYKLGYLDSKRIENRKS